MKKALIIIATLAPVAAVADTGADPVATALAFLLIFGGIQGFIGWLIAKGKGRGKAGFWWSFFLGWIGWIIAACMKPSIEAEAQRQAHIRAILGDR